MSDDNDSLSFPFSLNSDERSQYEQDNYLTEKQNEISNNFNLDMKGFDPSPLIYGGNESIIEKTTNILASNTNPSSKSNPSSEIKSENNSERSTDSSAADKNEKINFKAIKLYLVDDINNTIKQMTISEETENKMLLDKNKKTEEIEEIFTELNKQKKRIRIIEKGKRKNKTDKPKDIKSNEETILGRKRKNDATKGKRTKFSPYNIIKNQKIHIIHYILRFINRLIKSLYTKEQINQILNELNLPEIKSYNGPIEVIKKIQHKIYANETKRDENLKFLTSNFKTIFSKDISGRFKGAPNNSNELIISRLLKDEDNKVIFDFIFKELTVDYWLENFTNKTELKSHPKISSLNNKEINIIEENFERIEGLLIEILNNPNYDSNYYHCYTILIFNFKEYIKKKESRNKKKKYE